MNIVNRNFGIKQKSCGVDYILRVLHKNINAFPRHPQALFT